LRLDRDCRYLRINERMAAITGKPVAEHIGKTIAEIIPPLAPAFERVHRRVMETGESVLDLELRGSTANDGKWERDWLASFYPLRARDGSVQAVAGVVQEITDRKRTEEELTLRNQELRTVSSIVNAITTNLDLQAILDHALRGALDLTDVEGGLLCLVNQERRTLHPAAAINVSPQMIEDYTRNAIRIGDCLCGSCAQAGKPVILWDNASGSEFAMRESTRNEGIRFYAAFPLMAKGQCIAVLCVFDRTERKPTARRLDLVADLCGPIALAIENARLFISEHKARAGAEATQKQLQLAVQAARMGVWHADLQNDRFSTIHGSGPISGLNPLIYPVNQKALFELIHPDDREHVGRRLQLAFDGAEYQAEFRVVLPDGNVRWVAAYGQCVRDAAGKPLTLTGVDLDVTERKHAEEALRREQIFTSAVLDSVPGLLYLYDEHGRLIRWNRRHEEITGFTADELSGKHVMDWFQGDPESGAKMSASIQKAFRDGHMELEARFQTRKGQKFFYFTGVRLSIDSKPYLAGIGIDISGRKQLEEQFRQAQKMEAVGQLAGGVAHDFNNLLTVIHGNAALLADIEGLNEDDAALVRQIIEAADRAATLTRQLLVFGRKQMPQLAVQDLNEIVNNMMKMLRRILGEDVALQSDFTPNLPPLRADAGMIEQIIMNLAVNARDAMPRGGTLRIATSAETIREDRARQIPGLEAGTYLCLEVSDTGCGIVPDHLPHIFEPFFTTKEVGKGTGLGLATVYGVVKQHNGGVEVKSSPGKGTMFRVYLPALVEVQEETGTPFAVSQLPSGTETILVVEDDASVRLFVNNLLQRFGYTLLLAGTGAEAVEIWNQHKEKIGLILTVMALPGGVAARELVERFRSDKPDLKVIYTSSYSAEGFGKGSAALAGSFNFLQKPYHSARLVQAVRDCLDEQ
jgi:PAS domain S-box-containing protein